MEVPLPVTCILLDQKRITDGGSAWLGKLVPLHSVVRQEVSGGVRLAGSSVDFTVPWGDSWLKEAKTKP